MEQTSSTAQAVSTPSAGIDGVVSTLLTRVMDSMFAPKKWERSSNTEGTAGMTSHATGDTLLATEGVIESIITYSNGGSSFSPSVEIKVNDQIVMANVQGSMSLKKGQKVSLIQGSYVNKAKETIPCLVVTGTLK